PYYEYRKIHAEYRPEVIPWARTNLPKSIGTRRTIQCLPKRRWSADEFSAVVEFAKADDGSRKSLDVLISGRSYMACAQLWGKLKRRWRSTGLRNRLLREYR
ncbi:MAG: hypothetical protein BJ554DRAFT_1891, partial [Olpidium bornovanus]